MKRLAVYSVETGPAGAFDGFGVAPNEEFDLILFTDDPGRRVENWQVRHIEADALGVLRKSKRPQQRGQV